MCYNGRKFWKVMEEFMLTRINHLIAADKVRPDWVVNSFPIIKLVLVCMLLVCAILMIVAVTMQHGNTNGMTGITGDTSDTFYNRNKGQSMQGKIKKLTVIDAILMVVLCVTYLILNAIYAGGLA